jgi:hypothetical protein
MDGHRFLPRHSRNCKVGAFASSFVAALGGAVGAEQVYESAV